MGEVINFPQDRMRLRAAHKAKRQRRKGPWLLRHLQGKKPRGHTLAKRGPRGRVLMATDQVWVEIHSGRLWVIQDMHRNKKRKDSLYPNDVVLVAYRASEMRLLAETGVRQNMRVWEDYLVFNKETMEKFDRLSGSDPTSPWYGCGDAAQRARNFFSFDADGNPID